MGHLSIYGLSKNVYNGADGDVIESLLHKLLISYVDPIEKENGILWDGHKASNEWVQKCKVIVKNMEPLWYNQGKKEKCKRA
ncbi:1027_t:CDS:2 [Paraglomus brasilianum]|uniref:1027_t:CDS:1 n=1 Tax=Paraglomus brasilianum TaxID=144538 RepID=A0A9N9D9H2_9GLOM|nr:1027_t:CDS:2 [Paraglomus brasilianum]